MAIEFTSPSLRENIISLALAGLTTEKNGEPTNFKSEAEALETVAKEMGEAGFFTTNVEREPDFKGEAKSASAKIKIADKENKIIFEFLDDKLHNRTCLTAIRIATFA